MSTRSFLIDDISTPTGGCACCAAPHSTISQAPETPQTTQTQKGTTVSTEQNTATYLVQGMTCGHCVGAVTSELQSLPEVSDVSVELHAGATSSVTVTSTVPLREEQVAAALDEAGDYSLASSAS